ncbi:MAG: RDD family protein [Alphaproteobacteria bacterium]
MSDLPSTEIAGPADDIFDPGAHAALFVGVTWRRVLAYAIDVILIALVASLIGLIFAVLGLLSFGLLSPLLSFLVLFIPLAYHTLFIGGPASATPGMRLFRLEVRRLDGTRPGFLQAGLLTVMFYATVGFTGMLVLLIALFNPRGRTLHDILCGTLVTLVRKPG